jgi:hypothetical protein
MKHQRLHTRNIDLVALSAPMAVMIAASVSCVQHAHTIRAGNGISQRGRQADVG